MQPLNRDSVLPSGRTADEALSAARARGAALRRRRAVAVRTAPVLALLVVLLPAWAYAVRTSDPATRVTTPAGEGEGPTATEPEAGFGPETTTTTSTLPAGAGSTTTAPATQGGAKPAPSNGSKGMPSASEPEPDSRPAPQPGVRACKLEDLQVTAATSASTYKAGETVEATGVLRNVSSAPCHDPAWEAATVFDEQGNEVAAEIHDDLRAADQPEPVLAPGESRSVRWTWNQVVRCENGVCTKASPGTYSVELRWDAPWPNPKPAARTAQFTITA